MSHARLLAVEVERFKSFKSRTRMDLAPITVLLGRNNSGKSSLIQPLLLLKQTLMDRRPEIALDLSGELLAARGLRDLTHGWPDPQGAWEGPIFLIEWESRVNLTDARRRWVNAQRSVVAERAGLPWLAKAGTHQVVRVRLRIETGEEEGANVVHRVALRLVEPKPEAHVLFERDIFGQLGMTWNGEHAASDEFVRLDHFLPYVDVAGMSFGRNDYHRAYLNGWLSTFAPAIEDLRGLLGDFLYLSSAREVPREQNPPVSAPPLDVGPSGARAAEMFKSRARDLVHYLPPLRIEADASGDGTRVHLDVEVRERPLADAVNEVLSDIGVEGSFSVEDGAMFGYRLLFGKASLPHVGRGLTYLLPVVEVGLLGDPLRFKATGDSMSLAEYNERAGDVITIGLEEPESHLHPKVQSRLAHWLVALAHCNRQIIVETHSDHLVRRLRGLVARAGRDSPLERWLLDNVRIYGITQEGGVSDLTAMKLTPEGGISEEWPGDFMDEASDEDRTIYYASLDKKPLPDAGAEAFVIHDDADGGGR